MNLTNKGAINVGGEDYYLPFAALQEVRNLAFFPEIWLLPSHVDLVVGNFIAG